MSWGIYRAASATRRSYTNTGKCHDRLTLTYKSVHSTKISITRTTAPNKCLTSTTLITGWPSFKHCEIPRLCRIPMQTALTTSIQIFDCATLCTLQTPLQKCPEGLQRQKDSLKRQYVTHNSLLLNTDVAPNMKKATDGFSDKLFSPTFPRL